MKPSKLQKNLAISQRREMAKVFGGFIQRNSRVTGQCPCNAVWQTVTNSDSQTTKK
jgi:hypothetical protein